MKENTVTLDGKKTTNQNSNQQNVQQNNHAVIILASGLSRRLGQAKQLLCKNGEPLIGYMIKLAASTNPKIIIIVIPKGGTSIASKVAALSYEHLTVKTIINQTPETGMGYSLAIGIEALAHFNNNKDSNREAVKRVLIMGVDQVLLDKKHLIALLADNHAVVASRYAKGNHGQSVDKKDTIEQPKKNIIGLPLVIDYQLLKQWQPTLSGDKGLRHLIRALPPHQLTAVMNLNLSYDIDTPEQLAYARQQGWVDAALGDNT
ncbi:MULTISPECIES: NTP transferase domain-containing protein [unclassified Psychrobacter]|uniref:NTP transferase domain-containing protein n=1 Tax=unclassified Psychrobacter TaxID=196806 RepID=UPI0025F099CB|nr:MULTISPECIES: NTP transferase domain-containing protein [unclassified Psychrobacter]